LCPPICLKGVIMPLQCLTGFHDIYGDKARLFNKAESTAREVFRNFGFEEIKTPILEKKELFARALGSETDVVQKEMYGFLDRSKVSVALRPEGTAGVVRAYLENNFDKTKGLAKFYYMGPMFRSERPQAGRLRQFHQIGAEQLGTDSPYADAETIHCLAVFLERVGVGDYKIKLNNLGTFEERDIYSKAIHQYLMDHHDLLCEDCKSRYRRKNFLRILDCKNEVCRNVIRKGPVISDILTTKSRDYFTQVKMALDGAHIKYNEDPFLIRGLDYYTKTVFEVTHPKLGAQDAVAAGGRYDGLIESFGGPKAGAVGFALGVERLLMCMVGAYCNTPLHENSFFIVALGEAAFREAFKLLSELRQKGVKASMDFSTKSMKSQMRSADKSQSRYAIILGEDELKKKSVVLKDMRDGSQKELSLDNLITTLKVLV